MPHLVQPKKEEEDEEETRIACKKKKIKTEENGTVKRAKTKPAGHKKANLSVKNERVVWGKQASYIKIHTRLQ